MEVVDYGRSYLFFTAKGRINTARLQVESCLQVSDLTTGTREEFFFFASCKAENTHAPGPLFQDPNYDFCGAFSERDFVLFRTPPRFEEDRNSRGAIASTFESARQVIRWLGARLLETRAAISEATLAGTPLVGRTEWEDRAAGWQVRLEYPVKTMNVHPESGQYQIDTGPLPFPDGGHPGARWVERLVPAFVAWNIPDRAEFILQRPTPLQHEGREIGRVLHYSEIRVLSVTNAILAAGE
jgi:hypothetical protein